MTFLRQAAALAEQRASHSSAGAEYLKEFANAVHRPDVRVEAIESVLAALIRLRRG
jgi:hypothetical protein